MELVQKTVASWVEETFGCTLSTQLAGVELSTRRRRSFAGAWAPTPLRAETLLLCLRLGRTPSAESASNPTLAVGAKIDCKDAQGHTPLSEAACGGQLEICQLLLKHGANPNSSNSQGRTPVWRAAFMDKRDCVDCLLKAGSDPRTPSDTQELPVMVAPSVETKEMLKAWDVAETDRLIEEWQAAQAGQWVPPPPDPADQEVGEAGYSLQIALTRLADALDSVCNDSDRYSLLVDLGGKATTYFQYRDCNMLCYCKPDDIVPERIRMALLGALRFGKPFVLDMMSLQLQSDEIEKLFEAVQPGLLSKILSRKILLEENYSTHIKESDGDEYSLQWGAWKAATVAHFHFVVISKLPVPPDWFIERFFIVKVA